MKFRYEQVKKFFKSKRIIYVKIKNKNSFCEKDYNVSYQDRIFFFKGKDSHNLKIVNYRFFQRSRL